MAVTPIMLSNSAVSSRSQIITPSMAKLPLATTIASLLVWSLSAAPCLTLGASVQVAAEAERARRGDYERRGIEAIANGDEAMKRSRMATGR